MLGAVLPVTEGVVVKRFVPYAGIDGALMPCHEGIERFASCFVLECHFRGDHFSVVQGVEKVSGWAFSVIGDSDIAFKKLCIDVLFPGFFIPVSPAVSLLCVFSVNRSEVFPVIGARESPAGFGSSSQSCEPFRCCASFPLVGIEAKSHRQVEGSSRRHQDDEGLVLFQYEVEFAADEFLGVPSHARCRVGRNADDVVDGIAEPSDGKVIRTAVQVACDAALVLAYEDFLRLGKLFEVPLKERICRRFEAVAPERLYIRLVGECRFADFHLSSLSTGQSDDFFSTTSNFSVR